jgi:hypothetical protein
MQRQQKTTLARLLQVLSRPLAHWNDGPSPIPQLGPLPAIESPAFGRAIRKYFKHDKTRTS